MRKLYFSFILLSSILFSLLVSPPVIFGQKAQERWICLDGVRCDQSDSCKNLSIGAKFHKAWLTTKTDLKPLPDTDTYIVECVATGDDTNPEICTTGNSATDGIVYGNDNLSELSNKLGYKFEGLYAQDGVTVAPNPKKSDNTGEIGPLIWGDSTPKGHLRKWLALNYYTPIGGGAQNVPMGALQQGTIDFDFNTAEKDCLSIAWDPFGRVFDSSSLEPIIGASVKLLLKRADGSFTLMTPADILGGNIINPQMTAEDGMFSFVVPDGTYKIAVNNPNYTFPVTDLTGLQVNYSKAYYDIYPAATGEEIVQSGKIQHRDIPLTGVNGYVSLNPPKLMERFYESVAGNLVIVGRVSHPFAKITAYSAKPAITESKTMVRYRQVGQTQADKMGKFKLEIDQSTFEINESFDGIDVAKVDLTLLAKKDSLIEKMKELLVKLFNPVKAQTKAVTTIKFDPIPRYLEGYAYDDTGKIIPNATVGVYLTFSNKPYYETKADETGFFKITSENLPNMAYKLRYTTPGGAVIRKTTTDFIAQNQKYLADNKVNLTVFKNQQGKIITKKTITPAKTIVSTEPVKTIPVNQTTNKNNIVLIIAILVFLLIAIVVILGIYLLKKKSENQQSIY